jgi:hypothetical protein
VRRISVLTVVFVLLGVLSIVVAVIYLTTKATDLPSFLPGHIAHAAHPGKYTKRAAVSFVAAGVFFVIAILAVRRKH